MPKIILLSAPSRGGKNAVIAKLTKDVSLNLKQIVTCTTRPRRDFEKDGVDYFFVSKARFEAMIAAGALLEWAHVHTNGNHMYGTPKAEVEKALKAGLSPLLIIDVQGVAAVKKLYPGQTLSIFLKPPSLEVLRQRFTGDPNFTPEMIEDRLATARKEMQESIKYDHVVINRQGKLDATVKEVKKIISK